MPSNNSDINLFLILQNYLKPFETYNPPSSPKPLSQSECRIKITSQLLSESECRNLCRDLTQKTETNKMAEARHNADKHYLFVNNFHNKLNVTEKKLICVWPSSSNKNRLNIELVYLCTSLMTEKQLQQGSKFKESSYLNHKRKKGII